jgi:ABC-type antimicrobial peptide transport system ATPase subunit
MERFKFKKLKEVESKEQYHVEISALGNLGDDMDFNRAWKTFRGNIKLLARNSLGCRLCISHCLTKDVRK